MSSVIDILSDADKNIHTIINHKNNRYLRNLLEAAFLPEKKLLLPEGVPEYKSNVDSAYQNQGAIWQIARKIDVFYRSDVKSIVREVAFLRALESISDVEGDLLVAIKEQNVDLIYPNLTYENLKNVGYF